MFLAASDNFPTFSLTHKHIPTLYYNREKRINPAVCSTSYVYYFILSQFHLYIQKIKIKNKNVNVGNIILFHSWQLLFNIILLTSSMLGDDLYKKNQILKEENKFLYV